MMNLQKSSEEILQLATELQARRSARSSLQQFTVYTKPDYEVSWHHEILCDYLDRFADGEIKRLIISMPPRHGKSELVSRRLPAYLFGKYPDKQIISCSYSADLAARMNRDVQRIIESQEYCRLFPGTKLADNARTSAYVKNNDTFEIVDRKGVYRCAGVGGGITGMGCDIGIIDDPIKNREEALSSTYREKVWEWFTSTFYTRLEKDAQVLITMTRWHQDDLIGRILQYGDPDEWTRLTLPALSSDDHIEPYDKRAASDMPLWDNKFNADALADIRNKLGVYQWSAMYQQNPVPEGGGMWKEDIISQNRVQTHPDLTRVIVGVDPAVTSSSSSDETGIIVAGIASTGHLYVLADRSLKGTPSAWSNTIVNVYQEYRADKVIAEVNNGGEIIETMIRNLDRTIPYEAVRASRGKAIRAEPIAALYEQGLVHHVGRFPHLEDQMCNWIPGEKSPDRMDALVWALTYLTEKPARAHLAPPICCSSGGFYQEFFNTGPRPPVFGHGWNR